MNKRLTRSELLFFLAYVLWLVMAVLKLTYLKELISYKTLYSYVEKAVLGLLLLKLVDEDRFDFREVIGIAVLGMLYGVAIQSNAEALVLPLCFIWGARNISYQKIFKVTIFVQTTIMFLSVTASLVGMIPNEVWDVETRARYSLGYTFCTYGSHISFFITLMYMGIRKKINILETFGLLGWNFVWFQLTNTRIDLFLCVPAILCCFILGKLKFDLKRNRICCCFLVGAAPLFSLGAIGIHWFYDYTNPFWNRMNEILNGRLAYGYKALHEYGIPLLGQAIKWVGRGGIKKNPGLVYNYVDCSFVKYSVHYGAIFLSLLILGCIFVGMYVIKENNIGLAIAFLFWLLYGMIDAELFELSFQPFMLLLGCPMAEGMWKKAIVKKNGGINVHRESI